jgi:hypothetical protein
MMDEVRKPINSDSNEALSSIESGEFPEWVSYCKCLGNGCAPWNVLIVIEMLYSVATFHARINS